MEEIRERITSGLSISRLPISTKRRFMEIANNKDFCKDYGFALKYLIDFHDGIIVSGNEKIMMVIEQMNLKLIELETKLNAKENKPEEKKKRTMLNGKEI